MKNLFVVNPKSGKGKKSEKFLCQIKNYCSSTKTPYEIYRTKAKHDAVDFIRRYLKKDDRVNIFACGGDGTLNDVINGSYGFENVNIGVIPLGSGNDFVRNFSDKENFFDLERQLSGTTITLDIIKCDDKFAINQCSMGIDAESSAVQAKIKNLPLITGEFAFVLGALYCLFMKKSGCYKMTVDSVTQTWTELLFCLAANTRYYGGGYICAPNALARDGYIDLVAVRPPKHKLQLLKMLSQYKKGKHLEWDLTKVIHCKRIEIEAAEIAAVNIDGECYYSKRAVFEIVPSAVKFLVPKGCIFKA